MSSEFNDLEGQNPEADMAQAEQATAEPSKKKVGILSKMLSLTSLVMSGKKFLGT